MVEAAAERAGGFISHFSVLFRLFTMIMFYHVRQRADGRNEPIIKKMISVPEKLISMERIFGRIKTVGRSLGLIVPALIVNKARGW